MTTKTTVADALAKLEAVVGPLAWNAKFEPPADHDDIAKAVKSINNAISKLKKVCDRQSATSELVICSDCDCDCEKCPTCDGTGMDPDPDYDDEEMNSDCPDCGGDGLI